jgi:hypothetical protein
LVKQRVSPTQSGYTYESGFTLRNWGSECVQLLIAKNDKNEQVDWHMRPYIAFLHTFQETLPFDMTTPLAKIRYKDECIYLTAVFHHTLSFPEKSFLKKPYTLEAHWNKNTNSFDIAVLRRYVIPNNYQRPSKKKKELTPKQQIVVDEVDALKEEIADEGRKARREFFRDCPDILAKLESGIEKARANALLCSHFQ